MAKILLVEDEVVLAETLRYNLEREGHEVSRASDGVQGLDLARTANPDLILLDVMLPRLDGFSVCRILRNRGVALSRDLPLEWVWERDFPGDTRTVNVHIRWLRERVESDHSQPAYTDGA